jgi:hypothetical protein
MQSKRGNLERETKKQRNLKKVKIKKQEDKKPIKRTKRSRNKASSERKSIRSKLLKKERKILCLFQSSHFTNPSFVLCPFYKFPFSRLSVVTNFFQGFHDYLFWKVHGVHHGNHVFGCFLGFFDSLVEI